MPLVLAIDQSTSATKALLFDERGQRLDRESLEHKQYYPQPGWVEHDAEEIWQNLLEATEKLLHRNVERVDDIVNVSITNQRETIVVFDAKTGRPLHPAIVWQCRRSDNICEEHLNAGRGTLVHGCTGLRVDAYFSASKLQWLVENKPEIKQKLESGEALIGTIDTYLIYRLTGGEVFATEPTNASRTLLFDIALREWSTALCDLWKVPITALAEIRDSDALFGKTKLGGILRRELPIAGVMGDSQASLFAQRCFEPGSAKATFGTGSSVMLNIGNKAQFSEKGLITALAWVHKGEATYAYEGIIIHSGATLNWLQNQLGFVDDVGEFESLAADLDDSGGVYLVPAFSGLGIPHWKPGARAAIVGLTGHSDRRHLARAALESIAYQLRDALDSMQSESGIKLKGLEVDGGPTANKLLMQLTADITETPLVVAEAPDCSALGASLMGLLGLGVYSSLEEIANIERNQTPYQPSLSAKAVEKLLTEWHGAVNQVLVGIQKQ